MFTEQVIRLISGILCDWSRGQCHALRSGIGAMILTGGLLIGGSQALAWGQLAQLLGDEINMDLQSGGKLVEMMQIAREDVVIPEDVSLAMFEVATDTKAEAQDTVDRFFRASGCVKSNMFVRALALLDELVTDNRSNEPVVRTRGINGITSAYQQALNGTTDCPEEDASNLIAYENDFSNVVANILTSTPPPAAASGSLTNLITAPPQQSEDISIDVPVESVEEGESPAI